MHARPAPRPGSTAARLWLAAVAGLGALSLAACATSPAGTSTSSATPTTSIATGSPSPSPTVEETTPAPTPTESSEVDAPYNGEVLVVTAEDVDGRLEVTAMVPGISEDTGTCRLELLDEAASASVTSMAGNGVTYCGLMSVTPQSGTEWRFQVSYESTSTRAESAVSTVESTR